MAGNAVKPAWRPILRYTIGTAISVTIIVAALNGFPWYFAAVLLLGTIFVTIGRRRIFRAGVDRADGQIICRFIPWYEGNAYFVTLALPIIAIASLCAGYAPGNPTWLRFTGLILLALSPLFAVVTVRNWRRCLLRITPSTLTARLPRGDAIDIPRDLIESIAPKAVPNGLGDDWPLVEITYRAGHPGSNQAVQTIQLGLQLTVEPANLLHALIAWKDATPDEPSELLSRIERILRGHQTTAA